MLARQGACGAVQLVVVSTIYTWLPSQLNRAYGLPVDRAAAATALVILAGFAGMIGFAHLADRAAVSHPQARLLVPAGLAVLTAGLLTTAFAAVGPGVVQFLLILVGGATMTAAVGPTSAVVVDVVHPALRATAISTLAVVQNLVGLAVGPLLAGWLSDRYGLTTALAVLPLLCVVSAAMFWYGSQFYERDRPAGSHTARTRAVMTAVVVPGRQPPQLDEFEGLGLLLRPASRSPRLTPPE